MIIEPMAIAMGDVAKHEGQSYIEPPVEQGPLVARLLEANKVLQKFFFVAKRLGVHGSKHRWSFLLECAVTVSIKVGSQIRVLFFEGIIEHSFRFIIVNFSKAPACRNRVLKVFNSLLQ